MVDCFVIGSERSAHAPVGLSLFYLCRLLLSRMCPVKDWMTGRDVTLRAVQEDTLVLRG